jgi:hypothetical protein
MNRRDRHGDYQEKSSHGASRQKRYVHARNIEPQIKEEEDWQASPSVEDLDQQLPADQANFAYQLLLLQQRLAAYEQLHLEEIAELRQEIERLRRAFLQETNPQLRAISPTRYAE